MTELSRSPAHVRADAAGTAWSIHWNGTRLDARLHAGVLVCDYFGPETEAAPAPLWATWREHDLLSNARLPSLVEIGPRSDCVTWSLGRWETRAPGCLVLTLIAETVPLACEVTFAADAATAILRRGTVLRHLGAPGSPPIPIAGAHSL